MRILTESDIAGLIDIEDTISAAAEAYRLHTAASGHDSARTDLRWAGSSGGCLLLAGVSGWDLTVKSNVHVWPDGREAPRLWGSLLVLWNLQACAPRALLAARSFNDHRTAAGFAVAARRFAAPEARSLAVFGAGKTAPMTIRYLKAACPSLTEVTIVGRDRGRAEALAVRVRSWPDFARVAVAVGASPDAAVRDADIVATVTTADEPVFPGEAAKPGCLVLLGGANRRDAREADDALMRRARVFVDSREGAVEKAGDLVLALGSGALHPSRIQGEAGAFLDADPPDISGADVVVFKSIGLAVQDTVLASRLVARAEHLGVGTVLDLEGLAG